MKTRTMLHFMITACVIAAAISFNQTIAGAAGHDLPWAMAAGLPTIDVGHTIGFYVWHEGGTVYLVSANESDKPQPFSGKIVVTEGAFSNVSGLHNEADDRIKQVSPHEIDIRFHTAEKTDGVKFTLTDGDRIGFDLHFQGHKTEHIFVGKHAREANVDPVIFRIRELPGVSLPWSLAVDQPDIQPGHSVGFYIWHVGNTVYIVTTSESDKGKWFSGQVVVQNGTITSPTGLHNEKDDHFLQKRADELSFRFRTHEATDGVQFTLTPGTKIAFSLWLDGHRTDHIFYGKDAIESDSDPLIFDLSL